MSERPDHEALIQRVKALEKQLSEGQQAAALSEKEVERYRTIVQAQTEFIVRCKPDGTRTFVNEAYLRHFGLTHEQAIGSSFLPLVAEEDRQAILDKIERMTPENPTATDEHRVIRPDGSIGWQQWVDRAFFDAKGKIIELQSVGRDITDRKVAEEALSESENRYKNLFSSIREVIIMADEERTIIDANQPALRELFGYELEEITGEKTRLLYADDEGYQGTGKEVFDKHTAVKGKLVEVDFRKKNGEVFQGEVYAFKLLDNRETPTANIGIIRDITNRKKAKEALQKSEEKYRSLISNIPDVAWTTDWHGNTIFISSNVENVYGYTPEEICRGGDDLWFGRIHPDDVEKVKKAFHELFKMGKGLDVEYRIHRRDGKWIWLRDRSIGTYEKAGLKLADGIFSDVTAKKEADDALRLSEHRFRSLVEQTTDAVFCYEYDPPVPLDLPVEEQVDLLYRGVLVECNDACARSYGAVRREDVIGKKLTDLFGTSPDSLGDFFRAFIKNGYRAVDAEGVETLEDGSRRYFLNNGHGVLEKGMLVRVWGTFRDVTERKKTEETLRKEKEFTEVAIDSQVDTFFVFDPGTGKAIRWNKRFREISGYSDEEIAALKAPDSYYSQEDREKAAATIEEVLLGGQGKVEISLICKDGRTIPTEYFASIINDESGNPRYIIAIGRDITERKQSETKLRASEEEYRGLFNNAHDGLAIFSLEGDLVEVNPAFCSARGYSREEVFALSPLQIIHPVDRHKLGHCLSEIKAGRPFYTEAKDVRKDGSVFDVDVHGSQIFYKGKPHAFIILRDITDRKQADEEKTRLEAQLRHAQKMEAVGQLAGGVAHDFNNFLTAIVGYANILIMKLPENAPLKSYVDNILAASERAANLTHSLLAFSRKQIMQPRPVELNTIVGDVGQLLRRIIGEDIDLKIQANTNDIVVLADRNQIEQALMNLATNARDAMPGGGTLTIETGSAEVDLEFIKTRGYGEPGTYAVLSVSDTGAGMDSETAEKIFEPFYTTKDVGKGTGLGLAMVYGIIIQHNGYITVSSEPGRGTTFTIYLPLAVREEDTVEPKKHLSAASGGSETIMVAEDDENVRMLTAEVLTQFGYTVLMAEDGDDAIRKFTENKENIDILLLDVVMPKKNGREVYEEACRVRPDIKALFLSGYTGDMLNSKKILDEGLHFVFKPVSPAELLKKLREVLDA